MGSPTIRPAMFVWSCVKFARDHQGQLASDMARDGVPMTEAQLRDQLDATYTYAAGLMEGARGE